MNSSKKYYSYLLLALLCLAIGILSIDRLIDKPGLPFKYGLNDSVAVIESDYSYLRSGEQILAMNGIKVSTSFDVEMISDSRKIGGTANISYIGTGGKTETIPVVMDKFYDSKLFIIATSVAGIFFWLLGVLVIISKRDSRPALLLFLILMNFSVSILSSPGNFEEGGDFIGYIIRFLHSFSYLLGSALFLNFIFVFPEESKKFNRFSLIPKLYYAFAVLFGAVIAYQTYSVISELTYEKLALLETLWHICEITLLSGLILGTSLLAYKYRRLASIESRNKTEWIFWGMIVGVGPFMLFWLIPDILNLPYVVSEELLLLFLLLVPASFSVAVLKFHVLDIEVLIKRSIIYFTLTVLLMMLFVMTVYFGGEFITQLLGGEIKIVYLTASAVAALLFNPLRLKIKRVVDRSFYMERYSFDKVLDNIVLKSRESRTMEMLGDMLMKEINSAIPVDSIAIAKVSPDGERLTIMSHMNFEKMKLYIMAFRVKNLKSHFDQPFSDSLHCEHDVEYNSDLDAVLRRWKIGLLIPLTVDNEEIVGALILGSKLSGMRYSLSDIRLLNAIAASAVLAIKRFQLQEKLSLEELELMNANKLNDLKSTLVASVTHELKTPLSSIKIFSELLQHDNVPHEKADMYHRVIESEADRLNRIIENILDFSMMERGAKSYNIQELELNDLLISVLKRMKCQLEMKNFQVKLNLSSGPLYIEGDEFAIISVLENLISNAIKYSRSEFCLTIHSKLIDDKVQIEIEDKGIGIPQRDLEKIFLQYYREQDAESSKIKGTGLGLSIVKRIIDDHKGTVEVISKEGEGSKFTLSFPMSNKESVLA